MLDWHHRAADSACHWWEVAGVSNAVDDAPHDWLGRHAATARAPAPSPDAEPAAAQRALHPALRPVEAPSAADRVPPADPLLAMPADGAGFVDWLRRGADVPGTGGLGPRILPQLTAGAAWMVVSDMPQRDDEEAGALFSGQAGQLLDAILRSIGTARATASLTSVMATRSPARKLDDAAEEGHLTAMLQRQVDIATPRTILLFGDLAQRIGAALPGRAEGEKTNENDGLPVVNHPGGKSVVVMLPHLDMMLRRPLLKAEAWKRLRPVLKEML